jgi:hypothetical protein
VRCPRPDVTDADPLELAIGAKVFHRALQEFLGELEPAIGHRPRLLFLHQVVRCEGGEGRASPATVEAVVAAELLELAEARRGERLGDSRRRTGLLS